jgi:hypothetical protein
VGTVGNALRGVFDRLHQGISPYSAALPILRLDVVAQSVINISFSLCHRPARLRPGLLAQEKADMRNLVFLGFIAILVFAVVGWFLDWYSFTGVKSENGKVNVQLQFDKDKIQQDVEKGGKKLNDTIDNFKKDQPANQSPKPEETKTHTSTKPPRWFN